MIPSTSPSSPGVGRGPGLAVIDTPPGPPGWENARTHLIRIVDPLGRAVAWLAPAFGGRCVGFAVRRSGERGTEWVQVFHSEGPSAWRGAPSGTGCGAMCILAAESSHQAIPPEPVWRFIERDPTAAVLETTLRDAAASDGNENDRALAVRFSAALDDGTLTLHLTAENCAMEIFRLHLGVQLFLVGSLLRDTTGSVRAYLPGSPIRRNTANMRRDIPPGAVARLGGFDTAASIDVMLITGVTQLCYIAPGEHGFASLLASAGAPPAGVVSLQGGAMFHLAIALRAVFD